MLRAFLLPLGYLIDKAPMEKADNIICVSEKVKRQVEKNYFKRKNIHVIRTGVELSKFKPSDKTKSKIKVNLNPDFTYGLYVGKGGYWIKGLDRAIQLSEEIYKINKNFRLIVLGSDFEKVKNLINKKFIIFKSEVKREVIPLYYSSSDLFFCFSRYEGGAPTLVVSEAIASGCLLVCSEDSEQEIFNDNKDCLILKKFDENSAKRITSILQNKTLKEKLIANSLFKIKELSIENWSKKILRVFFNQ